MEIDEIRDEVNTFETFLEKALEQKYEQLLPADIKAHFMEINQIKRWDLRNFLEVYFSSNQFPIERLTCNV